MQLGAQLSPIALSAGNNNDLTGSGGILTTWRLIPDSSGSRLTGMDASLFHDMELVFIRNDSDTISLVIGHQDNHSSAANRFTCPDDTDLTLEPHGLAVMLYDSYGISVSAIGRPGATGATGATGSQGATGAAGAAGADGAGFGTITENAPSGGSARVLGTAFQPSSTAPTMVYYHARVDLSLPLLGTAQEGYVRVKCDASNPPTTVRPPRVGGKIGASAAVAVSEQTAHDGYISLLVPPGHYVLLESVTVSGTPTFTLGSAVGDQLEQVLA